MTNIINCLYLCITECKGTDKIYEWTPLVIMREEVSSEKIPCKETQYYSIVEES